MLWIRGATGWGPVKAVALSELCWIPAGPGWGSREGNLNMDLFWPHVMKLCSRRDMDFS